MKTKILSTVETSVSLLVWPTNVACVYADKRLNEDLYSLLALASGVAKDSSGEISHDRSASASRGLATKTILMKTFVFIMVNKVRKVDHKLFFHEAFSLSVQFFRTFTDHLLKFSAFSPKTNGNFDRSLGLTFSIRF